MNIYKHEMRSNFKSMLIWLCAITGISLFYGMFYPMLKAQMDEFMAMINDMNPAMKAAFGLQASSFSSMLGYFAFTLTFSSLCAAIQAMNLGVGILSKEERERTADFLMTKPVSRTGIFTAKLLSALSIFALNCICFTALCYIGFKQISKEDFDFGRFLFLCLSVLFLQLLMFSIGFILSVSLKKIRAVLPVSLGLVFIFFAISAFAVNSQDDKLRYLTPFQYFKSEYILSHTSFESSFMVIFCIFVPVLIIGTYLLYRKRDIHAVN